MNEMSSLNIPFSVHVMCKWLAEESERKSERNKERAKERKKKKGGTMGRWKGEEVFSTILVQ